MNRVLKPAIVFLACLALAGCETTISSVTDSISSLANRSPGGNSAQSARINQINSQLADNRQQQAKLKSDRNLAENQRNEALVEMGKITGFGPKHPSGEMFNETLTCDPGMLYVMHDKNCTAAREEIVRIDKETNHLSQQEASLKAERANLEEAAKSQNASPAVGALVGCFSADTEVLLPGGALKPIRNLEEGERIIVFDEESGALDVRPVIKKYQFCQNHYFLLNDSIRVTAMHRFLTSEGWVRVKDLEPGARLKTRDGWTELKTKEVIGVDGDVFNLQVAEHHNFYVTAEGTSYLVHNTGWRRRRKMTGGAGRRRPRTG